MTSKIRATGQHFAVRKLKSIILFGDAHTCILMASTGWLESLGIYSHAYSCSICYLRQRMHCRSTGFLHRKENCRREHSHSTLRLAQRTFHRSKSCLQRTSIWRRQDLHTRCSDRGCTLCQQSQGIGSQWMESRSICCLHPCMHYHSTHCLFHSRKDSLCSSCSKAQTCIHSRSIRLGPRTRRCYFAR